MPLFSKVFKSKDVNKKVSSSAANGLANGKPQWVDSWLRTRVDPEEVAELLHGCTQELKSRGLDIPFLLLPFRPSSDPSAAKSFVRNYFCPPNDRPKLKGSALQNELKMTEVMVLISVMKWCWARLPGGVVSWETYKMFKIGEKDAKYARDSFQTFIPIGVSSKARVVIINDFFDLMAALAARGKTNGLSGYKLSRYAGWWAFEHYDTGKGFEAGYKAWNNAANATCHLFFAYLRSSSPEPGKTNGILDLPRSLQHLVATTNYPPEANLLSNDTTKVVMVVDVVSPTPYALLRRAKNFEYRDDDRALRQFAEYEDPVDALTNECRRVLRAISTTNQSQISDAKTSTSLTDPSWSRFEDIGFSSALDEYGSDEKAGPFSFSNTSMQGINTTTRSPVMDLNRPTTPSWADFLSSGFTDENGNKTHSPMLLSPDKMLPPINAEPRGQSSQSHRRNLDAISNLEPGELASITKVNLDDSFWWVWISSLAGEEPTSRKACFGRCALIETCIPGGSWMVMEEQVKGAAPEPVQGAYIAEKKSFLGFSTVRGRLTRRRSAIRKSPLSDGHNKSESDPINSAAITPDQQARIHKAAMELAQKQQAEDSATNGQNRRGRFDDDPESRTNSVFTLGPHIKAEASPAMQWAKQYDKNAIRAQYLGNQLAGKGSSDFLHLPNGGLKTQASASTLSTSARDKDLPTVPGEHSPTTPDAHANVVKHNGAPMSSAAESTHKAAPSPPPTIESLPAADVEPVSRSYSAGVPQNSHTLYEAVVAPPPLTKSEPETTAALPEMQHKSAIPEPLSTTSSTNARSSSPEEVRQKTSGSDASQSQRSGGIRRLFGTIRKNREESIEPPPAPVANPAVAAARRALESKINPPNPPPTQNNFAKYKGVKTPIVAATAVATVPDAVLVPEQVVEPAYTVPVEVPEAQIAPASISAPSVEQIMLPPHPDIYEHQPPRTRRDAEFDELSRIDTKDREQADTEFSRFDQGPLLEQPAAVPSDFRDESNLSEETHYQDKHQSVYSAVTMQTDDTEDDEEEEIEEAKLSHEVSANDRWAQIRRNAAERAARFSDDHGTRSRTETRTDDGETSGEETIESRVARIKARVAELTGNMEGVRR